MRFKLFRYFFELSINMGHAFSKIRDVSRSNIAAQEVLTLRLLYVFAVYAVG